MPTESMNQLGGAGGQDANNIKAAMLLKKSQRKQQHLAQSDTPPSSGKIRTNYSPSSDLSTLLPGGGRAGGTNNAFLRARAAVGGVPSPPRAEAAAAAD